MSTVEVCEILSPLENMENEEKKKQTKSSDPAAGSIEVKEIPLVLQGDCADDSSTTHCSSLGERIQHGQCLLTINNLLDQKQILYLAESSIPLAAAAAASAAVKTAIRLPTPEAVKRHGTHPHNIFLSPTISKVINDIVLERVLRFIDQTLCPTVKTTLFGDDYDDTNADCDDDNDANNRDISVLELFQTDQLEYANREPAINVYKSPDGEFPLHRDEKALTIFVALSDPMTDYEGGGTAFWDQNNPSIRDDPPLKVLKPPAGTVVLWGGKVPHKGMPISSGIRVVCVASFSRKGTGDKLKESMIAKMRARMQQQQQQQQQR